MKFILSKFCHWLLIAFFTMCFGGLYYFRHLYMTKCNITVYRKSKLLTFIIRLEVNLTIQNTRENYIIIELYSTIVCNITLRLNWSDCFRKIVKGSGVWGLSATFEVVWHVLTFLNVSPKKHSCHHKLSTNNQSPLTVCLNQL